MQDSVRGQARRPAGRSRASRSSATLVSYRNDTTRKTELVIFLRPYVVRDASLDGDLAAYRRYLPGPRFLPATRATPFPCVDEALASMEQERRATYGGARAA